jgi:GT2 family glycosyltransferase
MVQRSQAGASIIIPVFNKRAFTRQCLDRIARHTADVPHEVIIVDNGSTDGTQSYLIQAAAAPDLRYERNVENRGFARANNQGARLAKHPYLLFLNNDTLVEPQWLSALVNIAESDSRIGIVGIKQLFPYTRTVYHSGIAFTRGSRPVHMYPYADGDSVHVNRQREYQAVNGACLLIGAELFFACGGFDEEYVNGYEDVDLCLAVRHRGYKVVCCTTAYIYHYAQTTEGRATADDRNLARFVSKWAHSVRVDEDDYYLEDAPDIAASSTIQYLPQVEPGRRDVDCGDDRGFPSPYWRGTRVSVILTVADRTEFLLEQLDALARQSVLAEEFEAIVVDYGSADAHRAILKRSLSFAIQCHSSRTDPRAGAARNAAVDLAKGELILFLGEDSIPDERLLEEHLRSHARMPDLHTAVTGEIQHPAGDANRPSRQYICAPESVATTSDRTAGAAPAAIDLTRLDIGNASFKRVFLTNAWNSGIRLNPELTATSYQGADLALRLQPSGLRVVAAPNARTSVNAEQDMQSIATREYAAGCDAVILLRTHPELADRLDVQWIADAHESVNRVAERPTLRQAIVKFDVRTDLLLHDLVRTLDGLVRAERESQDDPRPSGLEDPRLLGAAEASVALTRDVYRTRGKARSWYSIEHGRDVALTAERLMSARRKIEWLAAGAGHGSSGDASEKLMTELRARLASLEQAISMRPSVPPRRGAVRGALIFAASRLHAKSRLRAVDEFIETRLKRRKNRTWLARYKAVRARLRPYLV